MRPALCAAALTPLFLFLGPAFAQPSFSPASIPLAVRSPYLNMWHAAANGSQPLNNAWPTFWSQTGPDWGWRGQIRIDGAVYTWLGADSSGSVVPNVVSTEVTPTRSVFVMQAGPMNLTVTFLSPVEPSDWVKQSLPFSYLAIEASTLDSKPHSVQVYSAITGEWLSGNASAPANWTSTSSGSSVYHGFSLISPQPFVEQNDRALDGTVYFAAPSVPSLTWQLDQAAAVNASFHSLGHLPNTHATGPLSFPLDDLVSAFSFDLGSIISTPEPVSWTVGYVRDPTIQYTTSSGAVQERVPYYTTVYPDISNAIDALTTDFPAALKRAIALDTKIAADAGEAVSPEYAQLVALGTRQALASVDITVARGDGGAADVMAFMKDVGTSGRVNPVEGIYAAFPAFLYLNASLAGALLAPLLESQSKMDGAPYAVQDLGAQYPVAPGGRGAAVQGVEQSGNMLIMMLAHARISGSGSLLAQHYNLTKQWADYLIGTTLFPNHQSSAGDGDSNANMTNLAIKGIIGVKAMADISRVFGASADASYYDAFASTLFNTWSANAVSSSSDQHLLGIYGMPDSWSLMYNLYADRLAGTNLVPQSVRLEPFLFTRSFQFPSAGTYGLPISSDMNDVCSLPWLLFASATVSQSDTSTRDTMIAGAWKRAGYNGAQGAMAEYYQCSSGNLSIGAGGPAVGAVYSHLALR
ncbi:uncharacterized protein BXZ73DRAFT_49533 [Epithele typhae]|uniref:uncharacterized protein n=1 Tax=Epithele typhae TaxID=378194 RepID=UPI0020083813|nr:uncharacterized protein BXZ73DRAFT_49533 [Epithele typhae]KAH9926279.1 hypothetical protein BXZ73DRAFT_49533 [Epithele typhae]